MQGGVGRCREIWFECVKTPTIQVTVTIKVRVRVSVTVPSDRPVS